MCRSMQIGIYIIELSNTPGDDLVYITPGFTQ